MSYQIGDSEESDICKALRKFFSFKQPKPETFLDQRIAKLLGILRANNQDSDKSFTKECKTLYREERDKAKRILNQVDGYLSLSVDVISSGKVDSTNGSQYQYMCLTVHFIDHKWTLRRFILDFSLLGDEKNSPGAIMLRTLSDWEIGDKVWSITKVNEHPYNEMFEAVSQQLRSAVNQELGSSLLNHKLFHVNCCADIVKTLFVDARERISKIRDRITGMNFVGDVSTWKDMNGHLNKIILEERNKYFGPHVNDCKELSDVRDLLENIYKLLFPLFEKGYQSAHIFLCNLFEVLFYLNSTVIDKAGIQKDVAMEMLQTLVQYVKDMRFLLVTASVMDPRLKTKYVEYIAELSKENKFPKIGELFDSDLSTFYGYYKDRYPIKEYVPDNTSPKLLRQQFTENIKRTREAAKSELESYLDEPVLELSSNFSAFTWWKLEGSSKYPTLSRMAREILAIPFTSVVGEDAFMIKPREVDSFIAISDPEMAGTFMCLRSWLLDQNSS